MAEWGLLAETAADAQSVGLDGVKLVAVTCLLTGPLSPKEAADRTNDALDTRSGWARFQSDACLSNGGDVVWKNGRGDAGAPLRAEWLLDAGRSARLIPDPARPGQFRVQTLSVREVAGSGETLNQGERAFLRTARTVMGQHGLQSLTYHVFWGLGDGDGELRPMQDRLAKLCFVIKEG